MIIILSTSDNFHANLVQGKLESHGLDFLRVNSDQIPIDKCFFSNEGFGSLDIYGRNINLSDISGVFVHHPRIIVSNAIGTDSLDRALFRSSWVNFLNWIECFIPCIKWVNSLSKIRLSSSVFNQLDLAKRVGFEVPRTCFSNDLLKIKTFFGNNIDVILKTGPLQGLFMPGKRILANIVSLKNIDEDIISKSPCLFQEYIDKSFELRVHLVDDKIFSCKIDSQFSENKKTRVDWRNYSISDTPHTPFELDDISSGRIKDIAKALGLRLGIFDFIVTKNQKLIFLECNSQGYWSWIEDLTGLKITDAVVDSLVKVC